MTQHPFDSGELGRNDPEMDRIGEAVERYSSAAGGEPPMDLSQRIRAALDEEPIPASGWWGSLLAVLAPWHGPARLAMGTAVVAAVVIGALALGDLAERARNNNTGTTPTPVPSVIVTPSPTPSATPSPTPSPTPDSSPTQSPSPSATTAPTASDDHGGDVETPSPSESDSSGSGGGGNGGPGGGD